MDEVIEIDSLNDLPENKFRFYMGDLEECLSLYKIDYGEPKEVYLYINNSEMRFIYILGD